MDTFTKYFLYVIEYLDFSDEEMGKVEVGEEFSEEELSLEEN